MKKISIFCSSFKLGGVERALINLANSFVEQGNEVTFIVSTDDGILRNELNERIKIVNLGCEKLRHSFYKLYCHLKVTDAEYLISGPTYPNIIALICNIFSFNRTKIIVTQHSYQDVEMKSLGLVGRLAPVLIKLFYNRAYKVVAVSNGVKLDLIENYKIRTEKIEVIYNAVLQKSFYQNSNLPIDKSIEFKLPSNRYLVAVGRLELVKNYKFLIETYAKLKNDFPNFNLDLVILGDGTQRESLAGQISDLKMNKHIHLLGAASNPLPIIKKSKLLLHVSLSESMGMVYVEALALNVPILTTTNNGAIEVLEGISQKVILDEYNYEEFNQNILKMTKYCDFGNPPDLSKFSADVISKSFLSLM